MHREYHRWHSPTLGRDMELLVLGHAGARVLVFPTSQGRFFEWEDRGMPRRWASTSRAAGSSCSAWTAWTRRAGTTASKWPGDRAWRHEQYDRYVHDEVVPFTRTATRTRT
jgi:esterase/lipase superfamily enzyme